MRWTLKAKSNTRPDTGARRYRVRFAWYPVETESASGPNGWDRQRIWLERVVKVERYGGYGGFYGETWKNEWLHEEWMPLSPFTKSLVEHNNQ